MTNVIDDPAYREVLQEMKAELARLQEHYEDQPYLGPDTPRLEWSTGVQKFSGGDEPRG